MLSHVESPHKVGAPCDVTTPLARHGRVTPRRQATANVLESSMQARWVGGTTAGSPTGAAKHRGPRAGAGTMVTVQNR